MYAYYIRVNVTLYIDVLYFAFLLLWSFLELGLLVHNNTKAAFALQVITIQSTIT